MKSHQFEPFGETFPNSSECGHGGAPGLFVMILGSVLWSLIVAIILARAAYFDPAVFVELRKHAEGYDAAGPMWGDNLSAIWFGAKRR